MGLLIATGLLGLLRQRRRRRLIGLVYHDLQGMFFGVLVLAHATHLPGNLHAGLAAGDSEAVTLDLLSNVEVGHGRADWCDGVAIVSIDTLKPGGQSYDRL